MFTQTGLDDEGRPVRDEKSTGYVGAIETAEDFTGRIYGEAVRRGLDDAQKIVVIGDGARWIWDLARQNFPDAVQIVDLYHAREHLCKLIALLSNGDEKLKTEYRDRWLADLDAGNVEKTIEESKAKLPKKGERRESALDEIGYFEHNAHRMRYAQYRGEGLFVGSGVVEAGCKNVIGKRLKQSGMEWTVRGANSIISLRCSTISNRITNFWEYRSAA